MCPDPDEDTPVACHMNPHWNQLQERFLVTTVRFILLLLGFSCDHPRFMLLPGNKEIWHINTAQGSFCHRCFYCALTYKVIAKFETFQEDLRLVKFCFSFARYIGYLANVTFNEGVRENHTGKRTSLRALNFFRQVGGWVEVH